MTILYYLTIEGIIVILKQTHYAHINAMYKNIYIIGIVFMLIHWHGE